MTQSRRSFLAGITWLPALLRSRQLSAAAINADYQFAGGISRVVLDNFLSRSISMRSFYSAAEPVTADAVAQYQDYLRMLRNIGAKHISFASDLWWGNGAIYTAAEVEKIFGYSATIAQDLHALDPEIIVGAAVFETINSYADNVAVPGWVFDAFSVSQQNRNFNHLLMLYPDHRAPSDNAADLAIDITQIESKMWYYYWARRYIDLGYEQLDMGELATTSQNDRPGFSNYWDVVGRIRQYAAANARRKWMLISSNVYPADSTGNPSWTGVHGVADEAGNLLFDYYYAGTRARENPNSPQDCVLRQYGDTIFGRSLGGIAPSGWSCDHLPYTVELDPGPNPNPGVPIGYPWQWGYCEPTWFMNQPDAYRADWLHYAFNWVKAIDPNGHYRPIGRCGSNAPQNFWYNADIPWYMGSPGNLIYFRGFNDEPVIKEIWSANADPNLLNGDFSRPVLQGSQLDWIAPEIPSWTFGAPIVSHSQPDNTPIPSGQTSTSMSGVARVGSQYLGSVSVASGQQVAFLLGTGSITQALAFPGTASYALQFSASQRMIDGTPDAQEVEVWLDGVLLWRYLPTPSFAVYNVFLGTPSAGTHTLRIAGRSAGTDTVLIAGARVVEASVSPNTPVAKAIVNAASGSADIAPGSLISIYGSQLAQDTAAASGTPLPLQLKGVVVSANGVAIPLSYVRVSPAQINAQLPFEIRLGSASLIVDVNDGASAPVSFMVVATAPEIFRSTGSRGLAINQDQTINGPDAPAPPGSVIIMYVTGQGAVDHPVPTGAPGLSSPLARPVAPVSATLDGQHVNVQFLGLAPGFVGISQANLQIPDIEPGDHKLVIKIGNAASQPVTITVGGSSVH